MVIISNQQELTDFRNKQELVTLGIFSSYQDPELDVS
jgi:hypothetical protein